VVARGVRAKNVRLELAAAYQRDAAVIENVTLAQPPQLHAAMLPADTDSRGSCCLPADRLTETGVPLSVLVPLSSCPD